MGCRPGDGDEWVQWVVLERLPREPRKDDVVIPPRNLKPPRLAVDPRRLLKPDVVRIRGGAASPCGAAHLQHKSVLMATTSDEKVTVLCVPPDGAIYPVGDSPAALAAIDWVREMFS